MRKMNLNRILFPITITSSRLPRTLIPYKSFAPIRSISETITSKLLIRNLQEDISSKCPQLFSRHLSVCFYSSAFSEELIKKNHPDTYITIPTLHFEDVSFAETVSHDKLCDELQTCSSLEDQMHTLASTLALSPEECERRRIFSKKIESFLKPFFGDIKIQMFGSTVNGFGFKGCDVDMSFETFSEQKEEISYIEVPDVPLVTEVMSGKVLPSDICSLPRKEQLLFIHSLLLEFYKETTEAIVFINAHVPLVRFYHDKYKLKCDLSCRNKVAFANTKLLYLFGKLDERVIPMMMAIRYWAKYVELIGKGLMFNTYTISLMVIHFLQTRSPPIIPSAEYIMSLSDRLEINDMNDTSFLEVINSIPSSQNTQTLDELIKEFFFYYLYFDFTRVICPFIGGSVPREKFFTSKTSRKFRMNTICVQDPMLDTHNVAELVDYKHCKKLFTELLIACRIFQNHSNFIPLPSSKWGLLTLFEKPDKYLPYNISSQKSLSFRIPIMNKDVVGIGEGIDAELLTAETILYFLKHVLFFECKPLDVSEVHDLLKRHDCILEKQIRERETEIQHLSSLTSLSPVYKRKLQQLTEENQASPDCLMLNDFKNFNSEHKLILCAECKATKNTWLGRDCISTEDIPDTKISNIIEKEHYISVSAAKQNEQNAMKEKIKPFVFIYECYLLSNEPESFMHVNFRPLQRSNFNPVIGIFLKEYLPKLIGDLNRES